MCKNINKNNWYYPIGILFFILLLRIMKIWPSWEWNNIILSLTAIIVFWYTLETKRLSDLSKKQIEINIRPILIPKWDGRILRLKNIGKSPAINILLEDIKFKRATLKFRKIPLCESEKEPGAGYELFIDGKRIETSGEVEKQIAIFLPNEIQKGENYTITIHYQDVENNKWQTRYKAIKEELIFEGVVRE